MLVIGPEHARVFREAGWTKPQLVARLIELSPRPAARSRAAPAASPRACPLPPAATTRRSRSSAPAALHVVHAGGGAGLFSVIIGGWVRGAEGSQIVCREIGA